MTAPSTPGPTPAPPRPRNPWPYFAVVVLAMVAVGDGSMVIAATHVHPGLVEDHPWLTSRGIDQEKAARARFTASGARLAATDLGGGRLRCTLTGPVPRPAPLVLQMYRPDAPASDRTVAWDDPATALVVDLARTGFGRVRLRDAHGDAIAEVALDLADPPLARE